MARIRYEITGDIAEWRSVEEDTEEALTVIIDGIEDGATLNLGGCVAGFLDGECKVALDRLRNARYRPRLLTRDGGITLEELVIEGNRVIIPETSDGTVRAALTRLRAVEEGLIKAEEKIAEAFLLIKGNGLFG